MVSALNIIQIASNEEVKYAASSLKGKWKKLWKLLIKKKKKIKGVGFKQK